jgi:hypothetical protein
MELELIAAMLRSQESFRKITAYIRPKNYSTEFNVILKYIKDYYGRDRNAQGVSPEVIKQQLAATLDNEKHVARFIEMLDRASATEVSSANVEDVILAARRSELQTAIAAAFAGGSKGADPDKLIEEYNALRGITSLVDLDSEEPVQVYENINVADLFSRRKRENVLPVFPKSLNSRLDGGVEGGDHLLIYGLTEIGKSAMAINMACGFANNGFPGIYFGNEDKIDRMYERVVCNLSGMTRYQVMENPALAEKRARENGLDNIRMIAIHPGSVRQIEGFVEKYGPRWIVVDQIRNLKTPTSNNKVIQLEEASVGVRNLGKKANIVVVSVTQAADSARNKIFLDTGDVDFSNVGIPGTVDVMMGFGCDEGMLTRNERGISLAKNKVSGNHDQFVVKINPGLSRVLDV